MGDLKKTSVVRVDGEVSGGLGVQVEEREGGDDLFLHGLLFYLFYLLSEVRRSRVSGMDLIC